MHGPFASLDIKSRLSACRVRWLLGTAAAGLLGFAQSAHAAPDPETCTGSGTTETCTFQGNQSSGISTSNTITGVAILKVQNLSTDILGSIVLARTTLRSLKTLDIDTGNYHIYGNQGINVTTTESSLTQSTEDSKNGTSGLGLTLNFAGYLAPTFVNNVASPQYAILLNEDGLKGFSFNCGTTGCAKIGGQGGVGASFDMFASGEISTAFYGVTMFSTGGLGGDGSNSSLNTAAGGNGGNGGAGGQQRFYTSGNLTIDTYSTGLTLVSNGGQGGLGNKGTTGGQGGNGGAGGLVGLDVGLGHTMTVSGVVLASGGGFGRAGGDSTTKQGLQGGNGGAGGRIDVIADGTLWIEVDDEAGVNYSPAAGLFLNSVGGDGARGGLGDGNTAASNAGAGGNGGYITIELSNATSQALHIETLGLGQGGIEAYSVGASGASMYGVTGGSAAGGAGGSGGGVNLNGGASAVYISTAGDYSRGIALSSQGASGGTGSDGTFWVPTPGAGGSAGRGGSNGLSLGEALAPGSTLTSQITTRGTDSAAIFVESIGGGKAGDAGDPSAFGKLVSAGSSGDGGSVQVTLGSSVNLETHGMDSSGIAALSVGGSGGSGGNTQALFGTGGSGSIGGIGGFVYVVSAAGIDTYGIASAGIRAQSIGGSGGNGGSATRGIIDLGGDAGSGGSGGTVHVVNTGTIYTHAAEGVDSTYINASCFIGCAYGIFAQSVGGSGGMAGDAASFYSTLGGGGGAASNGGLVTVDHSGSITTVQQSSAGIFAQSLGGSGGVSGSTSATGLIWTGAVGGNGGGGGAGGQVDVNLLDTATTISTTGEFSEGIGAYSIGGGGGSSDITAAATAGFFGGFATSVGGSGEGGGAGGPVTISVGIGTASAAAGVTSVPVTVITNGKYSPGVYATSIGGGGGDSGVTGAAAATIGEASLSVAVAVGGTGGAGGAGGAVTVDFTKAAALNIQTRGVASNGIQAASIGDGGGTSGVTTAVTAGLSEDPVDISVSVGGSGGGGGNSGAVTINTPVGGIISTQGDNSFGIYASSVSGGGGDAGATVSLAAGLAVGGSAWSAPVAVGACATVDAKSCLAVSGNSGVVTVTNLSNVTTAGVRADGIVASSISGGGGNAGLVVTADLTVVLGEADGLSSDVAVGGNGGKSGTSGDVTVTNSGTIITTGPLAAGIYAESISGGGGSGSSTLNLSADVDSVPIVVNVGGKGGTSGKAGNVTVTNHGTISTGTAGAPASQTFTYADGTSSIEYRENEYGIFAQSLGGGGGDGGSTVSLNANLTVNGTDAFSANVSVGGSGSTGGAAGTTTVTNDGTITTYSQSSDAIRALSYGGGGGTGGAAINTSLSGGTNLVIPVSVIVGGAGGTGATGGNVTVTNEGSLVTSGNDSRGVFAESIGGGGGDGGVTGLVSYALSTTADSAYSLSVQVGGSGGTGNHGGAVTVNNSGSVSTFGAGSAGLYARSIGGGGGTGGSTGTDPDWNQIFEIFGSSITDIADTTTAILTFAEIFKVDLGVLDGKYINVNVGGVAGAAGDGGLVTVTLDGGNILTDNYQSNGVEAYSIGGGGGAGGSGSGGLTTIASVGGDGGAAGNGGAVIVTSAASSSITTLGDSSHGIFAQSVGGGGGQAGDAPLSGAVDSFASILPFDINLDWESQGVGIGFSTPGAAGGGGDGGTVTIDVLTNITTSGYKSYGIFAQSVGGGGGTVGLSAISLLNGLYALDVAIANVPLDALAFGPTDSVLTYNGSTYGYGSGGDIEITTNAAITTTGKMAHGIYAQSAGGYTSPDDKFGTESKGGDITINSFSDVSVSGEGSIAILAQSIGGNGNGNILMYTHGLTSGGSGPDAAGVQVLDGQANYLKNFEGGTITCGQTSASTCVAIRTVASTGVVTIENTNSAGLCSGLPCEAGVTPDVVPLTLAPPTITPYIEIVNRGTIIGDIVIGDLTSVSYIYNYGTITGQIDLGPTCVGGDTYYQCIILNYGTWNPSLSSAVSTSSVGSNSLNNFGTINITGATTIEGSLKNQTSGNLRLTLDPNIHFDQPILTVTGLAQLDGSITPVISNLQKGEFKLLQAGTLAGTPQIADALLFNWQFSQSAGGTLGLSALSDFQPANIELTPNQRRLADYLTAAWDNGELSLSGHFARLLAVTSGDLYGSTLDAFSGAALLHQQTATLQALPTLLSDTLECPTGGARSIVSEGSCLWIKGGHKWGRYSGGDTNGTDIGSDFYGFGGQKEVQPDWFLSFAVGRLESGSMADGYSSSGNTTVASIGLKYQSGPWKLGAAVAMASGSYKSVRHYTMPTIAGGGLIFSGSEFDLRSQSDLNIGSLRLHASREFALDRFYVRPVLDIDLTETRRPDFEEQGPAGIFTLKVAGKSKSNYAVTPHVQIGGVVPLGEESHLRMYLDLGVRLTPDANLEIDYALQGVSERSGFARQVIDVPLVTRVLKAGAQFFRKKGLELGLEYELLDNGDLRSHSAAAKLGWQF